MKLLNNFGKNPLLTIAVMIVISLSLFLRLYHYTSRASLLADNSRDVQVARFAADNLKIPQIGQFSSAGPFFYGPWYYWFLEVISFLPFGFLTHWYVMTFIFFVFIYLIYILGREVGGVWVGLIAALYAAISPAQISFALDTWNPSIIPILVLLDLLFLIRFCKKNRVIDLSILGFLVGLSLTIHFQAMLTLPILIVAILSSKRPFKDNLRYGFLMTLGFLIALAPLIYFDVRNYWQNFQSILIFIFVDQFKIWVPNSWKLYIFDYWPETWAAIVGGNRTIAWMIIGLLSAFFVLKFQQFKTNRLFYLIAITFAVEFVLFRYYRGERHSYYSLFAHPSVLLLSAWACYQLIKINRYVGMLFLVIVCVFTLIANGESFKEKPLNMGRLNSLKNQVYLRYPNESFDIYGCSANAASISHPIALLMYEDGRNRVGGVKIGVCQDATGLVWTPLSQAAVSSPKINWYNKSTETVYKDTVEWWKKEPPKQGSGNFWKFIWDNFKLRFLS